MDKINYDKEPYRSMIDKNDIEGSKKMIEMMVKFLGKPDEKGNFRMEINDFPSIKERIFAEILKVNCN